MKYDVVIRCLNEAEWLPATMEALVAQSVDPSAVIFVDSGSTDGSRELAESYGWSIIDYADDEFNYSRSLNIGFAASDADAILVLSAHCVLRGTDSVASMLQELSMDTSVGAVYGRQLPTANSSPHDIRDLLTVFGRERLVFRTFPFFHNAFAMIRRDCWKSCEFDESVNGIEDRIWAQAITQLGFSIVYQPSAEVFHEHGLNHGKSDSRALRVVKALRVHHHDDVSVEWPSYL